MSDKISQVNVGQPNLPKRKVILIDCNKYKPRYDKNTETYYDCHDLPILVNPIPEGGKSRRRRNKRSKKSRSNKKRKTFRKKRVHCK